MEKLVLAVYLILAKIINMPYRIVGRRDYGKS